MSHYVTVCDKCLKASCWLGIFMCDEAQNAGLTVISWRKAAALKLEHSDYYKNPTVQAVDPNR